jgi:hypothetical protein
MIDLTTMGAGGGSIARYSREGALTVGPKVPELNRARPVMVAAASSRPLPTRICDPGQRA